MEVVPLMVAVSGLILGIIVWALLWAVRSGQFDDLEGPAWRILDDDPPVRSDDERP